MVNKDLNQRQRNFVDNLMKGMSQKKAYIEAGYKSRGNAAEVNASKLIRKPKVQKELQDRRKDRIISSKSRLAKLLNRAIKTHVDILENKESLSDEEVKELRLKLKSAKDILDRCEIGGKDTEINIENVQNQGESIDSLLEKVEENLEKEKEKGD